MQNEIAFDEKRYRRRVMWVVLAILVFILVYLLLLAAAITISTMVTIYGWKLVMFKPHWITIALALGGTAFGFFMLYVLLRFLFESEELDESQLMQVTAQDEPRLFAMIAETAAAAGCKMPSKVFLNSQVNASMSFRASVTGLVLPLRKRLTIGLGLMETLSVTELKAVLAHEFGHYSQRSMRVGAYVYQVNRILHSVLVHREADMHVVEQLENAPWILSLAGAGAKGALYAVRWVLAKVYSLVNLAHLALSREMEFHADKVAAEVTGGEALARALTRLHLTSYAERALYAFYERKVSEAVKTENIYPQLRAVIQFFGEQDHLEMVAGLPHVPPVLLSKFDRSKLVINNQWESHPSTIDRLVALAAFPGEIGPDIIEPSVTLLDHPAKWQTAATKKVFQSVKYEKPTTQLSTEEFIVAMRAEHAEGIVDPIYNGYYDDKMPLRFPLDEAVAAAQAPSSPATLFSDEQVDALHEMFALGNDLEILRQLAMPMVRIKTFDYDGQRFKVREASALIQQLEAVEQKAIEACRQNDILIFQSALIGARQRGMDASLMQAYEAFFALVKQMEEEDKFIKQLRQAAQFLSETHQVESIPGRIKELKRWEAPMVKQLREMRNSPTYAPHLDDATRKQLDAYLARDQRYFAGNAYDETALGLFLGAMDIFVMLHSKHAEQERKSLLKLQVQFLKAS